MSDFTPDTIAAAAARSGIELPFIAIAQISVALVASGGPLTAEEHAKVGCGEPIVTVNASGAVKVSSKLVKMRRACQPKPLARRVKAPITPRGRSRAPKRRRAAGTKTAARRAPPNGDPDERAPLTAAVNISNADRSASCHGKGAAMGQVLRFPLRNVGAVLITREAEGNWAVLCGDHGWTCGCIAEARRAARWLSRNRGLPIRELIGGAP